MVFSTKLTWQDLRSDERHNIGVAIRNSRLFNGLTDLFIKERKDGTMMKVKSVFFDTKNNLIIISTYFRWNHEEIHQKTWEIHCELFRGTYDSFEIPIEAFLEMVVR